MPITMTVERGNPLPWPIASVFTIVGAALIVYGFVDFDPIGGVTSGGADIILDVVAALLVIPAWFIAIAAFLRRLGTKDQAVAQANIPDELPEPPGHLDPAAVATIVHGGRPGASAVAGTVLSLAEHKLVTVTEFGPKTVVHVEKTGTSPSPTSELVLDDLRSRADSSGDVAGERIFPDRVGWWREYQSTARKLSVSNGTLTYRIPFIGLMILMIFTSTALGLVFFSRVPVFVGSILFANGIPHLLARVTGYKLSDDGRVERAKWLAFARYLHRQGSVKDVGPGGVVMWGPNLTYGVVLGQAPKVARALAPPGADQIGRAHV